MSNPRRSSVGNFAPNVEFTTGKWCAFLAAGLHLLTAIMFIASAVASGGHRSGVDGMSRSETFIQVQSLNTTTLHDLWQAHYDTRYFRIFGSLLDAFSWFCMVPPILCLSDAFGKRSLSTLMIPSFGLGFILVVYELLLMAGHTQITSWMGSWPVIKNSVSSASGLNAEQALAITSIVTMGANTWVFAFDTLCLGIAVLSAAKLTYSTDKMPRRWGHLSVAVGLISVLHFIFDILRPMSWRGMQVAAGISMAFYGLILQPIWLIWLGVTLGRFQSSEMSPMLDDNNL